MPTYIHLVRHGQGAHNLPGNGSLRDPSLTPKGRDECAALRASFLHHIKVTHFVASPMRRTIQTCLGAFYPEIISGGEGNGNGGAASAPGTGGKILCLPDLQEVWDWPCDTGSDPARLAEEFGTDVLDLSRVGADWVIKEEGSRYDPTPEKIEARARDVRVFLRNLGREWKGEGDAHIVVVTHGSYINFVTDKWDGVPPGRCRQLPLRSRMILTFRLTPISCIVGDSRMPVVCIPGPDRGGPRRLAIRDG
jgi:broad specificity phosphatase PhoE